MLRKLQVIVNILKQQHEFNVDIVPAPRGSRAPSSIRSDESGLSCGGVACEQPPPLSCIPLGFTTEVEM